MDDSDSCDQLRSAIQRVNEKLPECAHVKRTLEGTPAQKVLCAKLERGALDEVLRSPHTPVELKAHTQLMSAEGSGAWLHAMPCKESRTVLDGPLFRISILRRLRMPLCNVFTRDDLCTLLCSETRIPLVSSPLACPGEGEQRQGKLLPGGR